MIGILAALIGSRWVRYAAGMLLLAGAYETWKYHEQHLGAEKVLVQVEQKADANAEMASKVREGVARGQRGRADPYGVR